MAPSLNGARIRGAVDGTRRPGSSQEFRCGLLVFEDLEAGNYDLEGRQTGCSYTSEFDLADEPPAITAATMTRSTRARPGRRRPGGPYG